MPGPILHLGAILTCAHGGPATPTAPFARVLVSGQPVATQPGPWAITGCAAIPCVTGSFLVAATRVFAGGQPVVLMDSVSTTTPTGAPMVPVMAQTRVIGS
ncbi:hypothetical protein [Rhodovulum strictum]|uniref:PAAR motif-containing protein n=1 Tax=Rhodovulum strictum TaxID=58314 RepID=A0A844B0W9_9RHOB|nr:hypothetical protein [Rhodovulum strictum]MRH20016.1 hypothetical protein [Rhodovulum strictum]